MGMFDELDCSKSGLNLKCAQGHDTSKEGFQTKDLECALDRFSLVDGVLYHSHYDWDLKESSPAVPYSYTGSISFYTDCNQCPETKWKLLGKTLAKSGYDSLPQLNRVWIEYLVLLDAGKVILFKEVKLETLEDSRKSMIKYGWEEIT